ncbi:hypothetical protein Trydic_g19419 [Trypoxylus dichotomus]
MFPYDKLPPCSVITFSLKTISDETFESNPVITEISTGFDEITNITVYNEQLFWNMGNELSRCTFQIELDDNIIEERLNSSTYDLRDLSMCRNHEITVTPIHFNGTLGKPENINFEKEFQPITRMNLELNEDNTVQISYDVIDNIEECGVYRIDFDCTPRETSTTTIYPPTDSSTDSSTLSSTAPSTDSSTDSTTLTPTETSTDSTTLSSTESSTLSSTDPPTDSSTDSTTLSIYDPAPEDVMFRSRALLNLREETSPVGDLNCSPERNSVFRLSVKPVRVGQESVVEIICEYEVADENGTLVLHLLEGSNEICP